MMMAVDGNNITSEPGVEEASLHRIKVSYATRHSDHVPVPALNLKGKWLEAAGFPTGAEADIRVMAGCLVITARPAAREPEEPELMKALRKVCKLSARKQKQVQEFISVVAGSAARK